MRLLHYVNAALWFANSVCWPWCRSGPRSRQPISDGQTNDADRCVRRRDSRRRCGRDGAVDGRRVLEHAAVSSDDWAVVADRIVLAVCLVAVLLFACGVIR